MNWMISSGNVTLKNNTDMKHYVLVMMAAAMMCTQAVAQNRVKNLSTNGTTLNVEALQDATQTVQLNRYLMAGYNTLCLPLSLSAEQLQQSARDVQVERLAAIRQEGSTLMLYFIDCTAEGVQAGVPYLIYSPTTQMLRARNTSSTGVSTALHQVRMSDGEGNVVTFGSSWTGVEKAGRYGIPAQQSVTPLQSVLVRTEGDKMFLPTRCGFMWEQQSATATELEIKHVVSLGEVTGIQQAVDADGQVTVYDLKGNVVRERVSARDALRGLPHGIYVVGGEKVAH